MKNPIILGVSVASLWAAGVLSTLGYEQLSICAGMQFFLSAIWFAALSGGWR